MLNENWVTQHLDGDMLATSQDVRIAKDINRNLDIQMESHLAHVIMLIEQGIISKEEGKQLLAALNKFWHMDLSQLEITPGRTDLFSNMQDWLVKEIGLEVGGKVHIGRSRNDLNANLSRMEYRAYLIDFALNICDLMEGVLEKCAQNLDVVMPGYTHHDQHAQPTTLAHYMLWAYDVFARDLQRAHDCYGRMNQSSMGGAALCGTGFPINRPRMAELLGFDGIVENTIDATSSRDFIFEMAFVFCMYLTNLNRLSELLLVWNVREIDMIRMDRKYCSYSSIMPQKNNPIGIEALRGAGEISYGQLAGMFTVFKGTTPGGGKEPYILDDLMWNIIQYTVPTPLFTRDMIRDMKVNKENCLKLAFQGFSTMTELADDMVRKKGQSFAFAHKVVGRLAAICMDNDIPCESIDAKMIDDIAMELFNQKVGFTDAEVKEALDPRENVQMRESMGGPAPKEVERMMKERSKEVKFLRKEWADKKVLLQNTMQNVKDLAQKYIDE